MKNIMIVLLLIACAGFTFSTYAASGDDELAKLLNDLAGNTAQQPASAGTQEVTAPEPKGTDEEHNAADEILNAVDGEDWLLAGPAKTELISVTDTGAVISTTQITYKGTPVTRYKILYADKSLTNLDNLQNLASVLVDVDSTEGKMVTLKFEKLTPNKVYYVLIFPVNPDDANKEPLSMMSEEIMFTTKETVVADAPVTKIFENVSYTYKDNEVELTWTPSSAVEKVQFEIKHQSEVSYTKLGTAMMKDGKFTFKIGKPGTHMLRLNGIDTAGNFVGQEHVQTIKVDEVIKPADPVQTAPQVGPATDLMIALLIFASLTYAGVRFRKA